MLADKFDFIFGVGGSNAGVFGDAGELKCSRKGTMYWCVIVTSGSRIPKYDSGASPLCQSTLCMLIYVYDSIYIFSFSSSVMAVCVQSLLSAIEPSQPAPRQLFYPLC